ncbi:MAG: hypothetical protein FJY85_03380, partial [Deltaproteobacteria bacterium]|nr:hypothetical protein [Deltaproteobacteria bacterium]
MILCERKLLQHSGVIALLLCSVLLPVPDMASADGPVKILVMPFRVLPGEQEKELQSFSQHADKRIRSAIDLLGGDLTLEDEPTVEKLLKDLPSVGIDEQARIVGEKGGADLVVYGFLSRGDSQFQ